MISTAICSGDGMAVYHSRHDSPSCNHLGEGVAVLPRQWDEFHLSFDEGDGLQCLWENL